MKIILALTFLVIGAAYFVLIETPIVDECVYKLHYTNKMNSSLMLVHLKSIVAGVLLIAASILYPCSTTASIAIGSAIIGLHVAQYFREVKLLTDLK
jgi:phosphate/sulfate permease